MAPTTSMRHGGNPSRYKWTNPAIKLLVTIWSNQEIQAQLRNTARTQPIWDSIGRYMTKKGFPVSGLQCRTRIKNMTSLYQEAVASGDFSSIEPYYNVFHKNVQAARNAKKNKGTLPTPNPSKCVADNDNFEERAPSNSTVDAPSEEQEVMQSSEEGADCYAVADNALETLINRSVASHVATLKNFISQSVQNLERLIECQQERLEVFLTEHDRKQQHLQIRLDRLLTRIEGATVPQLTYMGPLAAEREAAQS